MKLYAHLEKELDFQTKLLEECRRKSFPDGYLYARKSGDHILYYHVLKGKAPASPAHLTSIFQ